MDDRILKFADSRQFIGRIARSGENNTRSLAFDCSSALAEYPTAQIVAVIQRPQGDPYTVTPDTDGTIRRITLTSYDLEFNGHLQIELRVIDGNKILKSAIYSARVDDSIRGEADAPGQPVRDVLDRLDAEIKQAQAVVDDIRQKLENGEFNGSDANVTAENIQSALGYMPVTPSDLAAKQNVLTDADKQSITKTGMTTGAAWTDAERKAARERMGVDKAYELIEEIVLEEEVRKISRSPFSYPCTSVLGCVTLPVMDSQISFFMEVYYGNDDKYIVGNRYGSSSGSDELRFEETVKNGVLTGTAQGRVRGWGSGTLYGVNNAASLVFCEAIIGVGFYTPQPNENIPAGTKIKIYGVRA